MSFVEAVKDLARPVRHAGSRGRRSPAERAREAEQRQKQATLTDVLEKAGDAYRKHLKSSPTRHRLPQGPRPFGRDREAVRPGLCARGLAHAGQRVPQLRRPAAGRKRPGDRQRGRRQALRPLPRPRDVPDPQRQGRVHRLRRPGAGRREAQVPELARNAGLQQGPRALWPVRGAQCPARAGLRARDRGLHGRGGAGPAGLSQCRRDAGHRLHPRPRAEAVPLHRQRGLQLRRRRRRPPRRPQGARRRPALCHRRAHGEVPVPAGRARPGQLHPRARRRRLSPASSAKPCPCRAS